MTEAMEIALDVLKQLNIHLTPSPSMVQILSAFISNKLTLAGKKPADLINLPTMSDPEKLAAMRILSRALSTAFSGAPKLFPVLVFQQVNLSIRYGNTPLSAFAYAWYGVILCDVLGDINTGYQFGQLAIQLLDQLDDSTLFCRTTFAVAGCSAHWKSHLRSTLPQLQAAYQSGVTIGDIEYAGWSACIWSMHAYWLGQELSSIELTFQAHIDALKQSQQNNAAAYISLYHQCVVNLLGRSDDPSRIEGSYYSISHNTRIQEEASDRNLLFLSHIHQTHLLYLFGHYAEAAEASKQATFYEESGVGSYPKICLCFYDALTKLSMLVTPTEGDNSTRSRDNSKRTSRLLRQVKKNQKKLKKRARFAPMNVLHKWQLVEAERYRVQGKFSLALQFYDLAISGAKEYEFVAEEALANELAAKFYLDWGKSIVAAGYLKNAYSCYASWGATAKVEDLAKRYPDLLQSTFQPLASQLFDSLESTISTTASPTSTLSSSVPPALASSLRVSSTMSVNSSCSSTSSLNVLLDFTAILEASQSLSSTIELDELLCQLTQSILQNAGGDRCTLLLPDSDDVWHVEAIATPENTTLSSEALEGNSDLPVKLIQYAKNTQTLVMIDDLETDLPVMDDYLRQQQPKSLLCLPLLSQGHLIGLLHLENRLTSCMFTEDRIQILNFLCTQAGISLENARLYKQAQAYSQQLESSQLQLVQNEKMSALGNLVAGVAHEINNPVGFLKGNIKPAQQYVSDLLGLIDLFLEKTPVLDKDIDAEIEEIDLDFIREDLPELLDSMNLGVDRIKSISTGLRTFSRADKDYKTSFDLHEGLDSTLLILKHRLKADENRPAIEIVKNYAQLPTIECFPGQLNQVFMNILANAIDALDEFNQGKTFAEVKKDPNQITVTTQLLEKGQQVSIDIRDNGAGMPDTVKQRIFDHLYTTKAVGKGTGLGLAIAQQIVTDKHSGNIVVRSTPSEGTGFTITLPVR